MKRLLLKHFLEQRTEAIVREVAYWALAEGFKAPLKRDSIESCLDAIPQQLILLRLFKIFLVFGVNFKIIIGYGNSVSQ